MLEEIQSRFKYIKFRIKRWAGRNKFVVRGAPFLICMVAASFGMENFARLRYDFRKNTKAEEELEKAGFGKEDHTTLEEEYKKMLKEDIDTWENIRGPRPWEDSKTVQEEARQKLKEKKVETS